MQIILDIGGHKAIPIRAIPQVTNWNESPHSIVQTLAAPKNNLFAYQMDAQCNCAQVPPEQWESWDVTLDSLTKKLKANEREGAEDENRGPWQIKTVLELPDDVFIWLDEFQRWYSLSRSLEDVPDDYQNDCLKWENNQERLLAKNRDPNSELSESELAMLDEPRPWSEQASDQLCLTPIFPPAIENSLWRFDFVVASPVAKPEAAPYGTPAAKVGTAPARSASDDDWMAQARVIADECFDHDTNANPTVRDSLATKNSVGHITGGYCFRVMEIMQKRGIKGPRGIITNPATVMRDALQGKKWWANKPK